jgi:uncharacterized Zn finger protein (UPF0148 family)
VTAWLFAWSLSAPLAVMTLGTAQIDAVDPPPPTAIERALVERACNTPAANMPGQDGARQQCTDTQLALLRGDFGVNLKRLSAAERTGLDAACRRMEITHGRDGYLDCVNAQLVALRVHRGSRGAAVVRPAANDAPAARERAAAAAPDAAPAVDSTSAVDVQRSGAAAAAHESAAASGLVRAIGVVLLVVAAIAGGSLAGLRMRRARRTCRECGAPIVETGDLCAACRHTAAETLRRAAAERMEQGRAGEADRRRRQQLEDDERRQQALREEEARAREQHDAQMREEQARVEREAEARRESLHVVAREAAQPAEETFDPYAVLGVAHDTTPEDLRAAYDEARSKYDQDVVSHLGMEVRQLFREKARAVDRAYQMLAG